MISINQLFIRWCNHRLKRHWIEKYHLVPFQDMAHTQCRKTHELTTCDSKCLVCHDRTSI